MYELLKGLRVVEGSAFVAAPTCGLYLAQMGAEVIRFDNIGGGPDFRRWPLADNGASLYWEGLNKAKKSIAIDLAFGPLSPPAIAQSIPLRLRSSRGPSSGSRLKNLTAAFVRRSRSMRSV